MVLQAAAAEKVEVENPRFQRTERQRQRQRQVTGPLDHSGMQSEERTLVVCEEDY